MADIPWPADLAPYKVAFYLQPHVGGSESPLTRVRKVYGLSAPRWVARLTFRGGYAGEVTRGDQGAYGNRLDAMIADLDGGLNLAVFHDWRRPAPTSASATRRALVSAGAAKGATSMVVVGYSPWAKAISAGDYIGGDGRPHIVSLAATKAAGGTIAGVGTVMADDSGRAVIGFSPPLSAPIAAGTPMRWPVTGRFQLVGDDAGQNEVEVGQAVEQALDFVEDLS